MAAGALLLVELFPLDRIAAGAGELAHGPVAALGHRRAFGRTWGRLGAGAQGRRQDQAEDRGRGALHGSHRPTHIDELVCIINQIA